MIFWVLKKKAPENPSKVNFVSTNIYESCLCTTPHHPILTPHVPARPHPCDHPQTPDVGRQFLVHAVMHIYVYIGTFATCLHCLHFCVKYFELSPVIDVALQKCNVLLLLSQPARSSLNLLSCIPPLTNIVS